MVQTPMADPEAIIDTRLAFLADLHATPEFEGERIDLVLWSTALDPEPKPIHQIALMQGLKIADGQGAAG
jgi:hypothetical protein